MTQPPDPVAALAEALHVASPWPHRLGPDSAHCTNGSSHGERAEALAAALHASGWTLSHDSEQEALVAALDRERVLRDLLSPAERPGAGYPCRTCGRRDMGHEPSCWYTRVDAAIEGRP